MYNIYVGGISMNESLLINNLIYLRKKHKLTQKELSIHLNYSDKVISKWERGEALPDIKALSTVANYYSINIDELINDDLSNASINHKVSNQLDYKWIKKLPNGLSWTVPILLIIHLFTSFFWMDPGVFFIILIFFIPLAFIQDMISFNCIAIATYKNHEIKVKSTMSKTQLFIDNVLVDQNTSIFRMSFNLTGKIDQTTIKANISTIMAFKLIIFIE